MILQIISLVLSFLCIILLIFLLFKKTKTQENIDAQKIADEIKILEKVQNEKMDI